MDKRYQVFVSSTYCDLIAERQAALKAILDLGYIPAGMEGFFATDQEQLTYIKKIIDECDYYILIVAGRYGSCDEVGTSFTEREYEYALSKGIPILAFIHDNLELIEDINKDNDFESIKKLQEFKAKVTKRRLVSFWNNLADLRANIIVSLVKARDEVPRIGWVRGNVAATEEILTQINSLRNDNESLRQDNEKIKQELKPRVANIAPLNQSFILNYTYYASSRHGDEKRNKTLQISWEQIFKIIGPSLYSPKLPSTIETSLKEYISKEVHQDYLKYLDILDSDLNSVKIQLAAYGFIEIYDAGTVSGGVNEFIKLTESGKRTLMEIKTIKAE